MKYQEVKDKGWMLFECISGSLAYGTELRAADGTLLSDIDKRGVFSYPSSKRMTLFDLPMEAEDGKDDSKAFELRKFFELAVKATPNMLELMWMPKESIIFCDPRFQKIINNRKLFLTMRAIDTFGGYARSQISKARGQNKLINNPKPREKPQREDFCWFVPSKSIRFDTIPLKETGIDLSTCRATAIPHMRDTFHVYPNGKGVFKGDMLVFESVDKTDRLDVLGVLIYNEDGFKKALVEWKQYWDWMKVRNEARWEIQGKGMDYNVKNMLHTIRTLMVAENIVTEGEPIVRFSGEKLSYLRKIREGAFTYEELSAKGEEIMARVDEKRQTCGLPEEVDKEAIDALFEETANEFQ